MPLKVVNISSYGSLKGQCQEIFEQVKTVSWTFCFPEDTVFAKNVCLHTQRLRRHGVSVVNDYADIVSV